MPITKNTCKICCLIGKIFTKYVRNPLAVSINPETVKNV